MTLVHPLELEADTPYKYVRVGSDVRLISALGDPPQHRNLVREGETPTSAGTIMALGRAAFSFIGRGSESLNLPWNPQDATVLEQTLRRRCHGG